MPKTKGMDMTQQPNERIEAFCEEFHHRVLSLMDELGPDHHEAILAQIIAALGHLAHPGQRERGIDLLRAQRERQAAEVSEIRIKETHVPQRGLIAVTAKLT